MIHLARRLERIDRVTGGGLRSIDNCREKVERDIAAWRRCNYWEELN